MQPAPLSRSMGCSKGRRPTKEADWIDTEQTGQVRMTSTAASTLRQRLNELRPQLLAVARRHGASNLRIYGSIATGHEHSGSDLDLLVDLPDDQSLLGLVSLRQDLEDLLGCSVDVTEAETLHPLIRAQILEQALTL